jgi:chlorite dismutase
MSDHDHDHDHDHDVAPGKPVDEGLQVRLGRAPREPRQVVKYTFFTLDPAWRRLPAEEREAAKAEFVRVITQAVPEFFVLRTYNLIGMHHDADFMVWSVADTLDRQSALLSRIYGTAFGAWLRVSFSYLAMTKHSQYVRDHVHEGQEGTRLTILPDGKKYLFVYPLDKKREWYSEPFETRNTVMREHIKIGHRYPTVKINTTYSFGLDDQEFVVAFESDYPEDFLDCVEELRASVSSSFTARDVPIFSCIATDIRDILDALGGVPATAALPAGRW